MHVATSSMLPQLPGVDPGSLGVATRGNAEEVAQSFEAVFASLLMKEMRNTLTDGLFGSEGSDVFGGLFDLHMGQAMTQGRGLGIKQMVISQWELNSPQQ